MMMMTMMMTTTTMMMTMMMMVMVMMMICLLKMSLQSMNAGANASVLYRRDDSVEPNLPSLFHTVRPRQGVACRIGVPAACHGIAHVHHSGWEGEHVIWRTLWCAEKAEQTVAQNSAVFRLRMMRTSLYSA